MREQIRDDGDLKGLVVEGITWSGNNLFILFKDNKFVMFDEEYYIHDKVYPNKDDIHELYDARSTEIITEDEWEAMNKARHEKELKKREEDERSMYEYLKKKFEPSEEVVDPAEEDPPEEAVEEETTPDTPAEGGEAEEIPEEEKE